MTYRKQYADEFERSKLIEENQDKKIIGEENITEGNFLIFADSLQVELEVDILKSENEILKIMIADLGLMVGGGL